MTAARQATAEPAPAWSERPLWQIGIAAALVAAAANAVIYVIARAAGVPLELTEVFSDDFEQMPVSAFVLGTLLDGGVAGTALAAACRRWAPHPRTWFIALAAIGTVASFALPIGSDGTTATKVVLSLTHVVAALIIVPPLAQALTAR